MRNQPVVRVDSPDRPIEISSSTARALSACRSNAPGAGSGARPRSGPSARGSSGCCGAWPRPTLAESSTSMRPRPLDREAAAGRCAASTGCRTGSPGRSSGRPRGRRRAVRPAGRRARRRPGWCGRRGRRTSCTRSVNSCRSSVLPLALDSAPPSVSGAGSPREQDRCSSHSSCRGVAGAAVHPRGRP